MSYPPISLNITELTVKKIILDELDLEHIEFSIPVHKLYGMFISLLLFSILQTFILLYISMRKNAKNQTLLLQ